MGMDRYAQFSDPDEQLFLPYVVLVLLVADLAAAAVQKLLHA
jgi:hypothetical protein